MSADVHRFMRIYKSQMGSSLYNNNLSHMAILFDTIRIVGMFASLGIVLHILLSLSMTSSVVELNDSYLHLLPTDCLERNNCHFMLIADLDHSSHIKDNKYKSLIQYGKLIKKSEENFEIEWENENQIHGTLSEKGRGLELSELLLHNDKLWTVDDRTGIVYEISSGHDKLYPRFIFNEGDGNSTDKGFKVEWMTTYKNTSMFIGSFGKEYVDNKTGEITSYGNMWVVEITNQNQFIRHDWTENYRLLQKKLNCSFPGYLIHEAVNYSPYLQKWVFLPRRVSVEPYDEVLDESRGSNIALLVDEKFEKVEVKYYGTIKDKRRGFSSFKFVPGTKDQLLLAVKSMEFTNEEGKVDQQSYLSLIHTESGKVLIDEMVIPSHNKYEGIEFIP